MASSGAETHMETGSDCRAMQGMIVKKHITMPAILPANDDAGNTDALRMEIFPAVTGFPFKWR